MHAANTQGITYHTIKWNSHGMLNNGETLRKLVLLPWSPPVSNMTQQFLHCIPEFSSLSSTRLTENAALLHVQNCAFFPLRALDLETLFGWLWEHEHLSPMACIRPANHSRSPLQPKPAQWSRSCLGTKPSDKVEWAWESNPNYVQKMLTNKP